MHDIPQIYDIPTYKQSSLEKVVTDYSTFNYVIRSSQKCMQTVSVKKCFLIFQTIYSTYGILSIKHYK